MSTISGISSGAVAAGNGLERTASHITAANVSFDDKAADLIKAAQSSDDSGEQIDLASAAVAVKEQALVNQILFSTFKVQAEQQKSLTKDLTG